MTRSLVPLATLLVANVAFAQTARESVDRLALEATYGVAPQPLRVADSYRRARAIDAATFTGTLLCEVSVVGDSWDGRDPGGPVRRYMGRVELDADIGLPNRDDLVRVHGPNDTNRLVFAVAGVTLTGGSSVSFALSDRDVLSSDPIGRLTLDYRGSLPLSASTERASIECRGQSADSLASSIDAAIATADSELRALENVARPDRTLVAFRDPAADPTGAMLAVFEIARLTGLADPRFLERRDSLRTREAAFLAARASLVSDIAKTAPGVTESIALPGTSVRLVVDQVDCSVTNTIELHSVFGLDLPMECAVHVTFRNDGAATTLAWDLRFVDDLGDMVAITRFATESPSGVERVRTLRVERGETRYVFPSPTHHAVLLRVARRRAIVWARLLAGSAQEPAPAPGELGVTSDPP